MDLDPGKHKPVRNHGFVIQNAIFNIYQSSPNRQQQQSAMQEAHLDDEMTDALRRGLNIGTGRILEDSEPEEFVLKQKGSRKRILAADSETAGPVTRQLQRSATKKARNITKPDGGMDYTYEQPRPYYYSETVLSFLNEASVLTAKEEIIQDVQAESTLRHLLSSLNREGKTQQNRRGIKYRQDVDNSSVVLSAHSVDDLSLPIKDPHYDPEMPWEYMTEVRHEVFHVVTTVRAVVEDATFLPVNVKKVLKAYLGEDVSYIGDISHKQFVEYLDKLIHLATKSRWIIEKKIRGRHHYQSRNARTYLLTFVQHSEDEGCDTPAALAWAAPSTKTVCIEVDKAFAGDQYKLLRCFAKDLKADDNLSIFGDAITPTVIHEMLNLASDDCDDVCYTLPGLLDLAKKRPDLPRMLRNQKRCCLADEFRGPLQNAESLTVVIVLIYLTVARPELSFIPLVDGLEHGIVYERKKPSDVLKKWKTKYIDTYLTEMYHKQLAANVVLPDMALMLKCMATGKGQWSLIQRDDGSFRPIFIPAIRFDAD